MKKESTDVSLPVFISKVKSPRSKSHISKGICPVTQFERYVSLAAPLWHFAFRRLKNITFLFYFSIVIYFTENLGWLLLDFKNL